MKVCPKNKEHKEFLTTARECRHWKVDGNGNFIEDLGCDYVVANPDKDNIWTCAECGAEAVNVE